MDGLTVWEMFFASMQARVDLLNKSFLISDAGDQARITTKNVEGLVIDNTRFVTKEGENIA
jgi:hypothetical protein